MAINYRDTRRGEKNGNGAAGHLLAALVAVCCLLWFAPQTAAKLENAVVSMLRLPSY